MIAIYNGCDMAKAASAKAITPISNVIIEVSMDICSLEIKPSIPKTIIINPTIYISNPTRNDSASILKINSSPNIAAIIPTIIETVPIMSKDFLKVQPIRAEEIPKNNKLAPTITEMNDDENIGKIININPRMMKSKPAGLLMFIFSPPYFYTPYYI